MKPAATSHGMVSAFSLLLDQLGAMFAGVFFCLEKSTAAFDRSGYLRHLLYVDDYPAARAALDLVAVLVLTLVNFHWFGSF